MHAHTSILPANYISNFCQENFKLNTLRVFIFMTFVFVFTTLYIFVIYLQAEF